MNVTFWKHLAGFHFLSFPFLPFLLFSNSKRKPEEGKIKRPGIWNLKEQRKIKKAMFAFLRRATEMFPRSRELAYEIVILQKKKKIKERFDFVFASLIIHLLT